MSNPAGTNRSCPDHGRRMYADIDKAPDSKWTHTACWPSMESQEHPRPAGNEMLGIEGFLTPEERANLTARLDAERRCPEWLKRLRQAWHVIRHGCIDEY